MINTKPSVALPGYLCKRDQQRQGKCTDERSGWAGYQKITPKQPPKLIGGLDLHSMLCPASLARHLVQL